MSCPDAQFDLVDVSSWRVRDEEVVGGDEKQWLTAPDADDETWLFKPVTEHEAFVQGEDWSEKVSAEMGALLGVPCARVELAVRNGRRGSISLDLKPANWELQHGAVLLAQMVPDYVSGDRERRGHSLANIERALEGYGHPPGAAVPDDFGAFDVFVGYLILDAWIANRDRHDENWARGNAYRFERPARPAPIPTLVEFATMALSTLRQEVQSYWMAHLEAIGRQAVSELVARVPGMSQSACNFAVELTTINRERLLEALNV